MNTLVFILGTSALVALPFDPSVLNDCLVQGSERLAAIATYTGSGPHQAWILNDSNVEVAGWYCR